MAARPAARRGYGGWPDHATGYRAQAADRARTGQGEEEGREEEIEEGAHLDGNDAG
jgi:hypothetical protein